MKITVFYVGSSLLLPLRQAEREINHRYKLALQVVPVCCTLPLDDEQWSRLEPELADSDIVFVIHITESQNAARLAAALDRYPSPERPVIVFNCLPELMRRLRLGNIRSSAIGHPLDSLDPLTSEAFALMRKLGSWMAAWTKARRPRSGDQYLKLAQYIPTILRLIPARGKLRDIKHYLTLFSYLHQPTPANVRSMLLYAIKHYVPGYQKRLRPEPPESHPVMAIYHPDAPKLFESFAEYRKWYDQRAPMANGQWPMANPPLFDPNQAVGLLLLRPQVISRACRHYDALIRALEAEGLPVLPILSTFMDNRQACQAFFVEPDGSPRVAQIVTAGFSFVGGPASNDSEAAVAYLKTLNRPLRTALSLDMQSTESWAESWIGLNPVQTVMQVAIPELDGATEPFVFAGVPAGQEQPVPLDDRCRRIARRLARWQRLRQAPRELIRLAFIIYCFPPNKGNLGTAADLDVFPSLWEIFRQLKAEGYTVWLPPSPEALRTMLLSPAGEKSEILNSKSETFRISDFGFGIFPRRGESDWEFPPQGGDPLTYFPTTPSLAHVAYRLSLEEYRKLCPYVHEIEAEWGPAPGQINTQGRDILIHGAEFGHVFVGVQPTFGYEDDPMQLLMAKGGAPHHAFVGFYTYLDHIFQADAVIHVGTHGALEFMPGKQVGLSSSCWPDRLIGSWPHIYLYSVNNPSEGAIAKRRSYAELISYLTPPMESAGLYKEWASLKELVTAYWQTPDQQQRELLFAAITEQAERLHLLSDPLPPCGGES